MNALQVWLLYYNHAYDTRDVLCSFQFWCARIDVVMFTLALVFTDAYGLGMPKEMCFTYSNERAPRDGTWPDT